MPNNINKPELNSGAETLGIELSDQQLDQFEHYAQLLDEENKKINLTRVPFDEFITRHFLDSLLIAYAYKMKENTKVIDVGTGAGLPGIPLQIAYPTCKITLLDATAKICDFLDKVVTTLKLDNTNVIQGRSEDKAHDRNLREKFHLVVSRAVAPMEILQEITTPYSIQFGRIISMKSAKQEEEILSASKKLNLLGCTLNKIEIISVPHTDIIRLLPIIEKIKSTPKEYPRLWKDIKTK